MRVINVAARGTTTSNRWYSYTRISDGKRSRLFKYSNGLSKTMWSELLHVSPAMQGESRQEDKWPDDRAASISTGRAGPGRASLMSGHPY